MPKFNRGGFKRGTASNDSYSAYAESGYYQEQEEQAARAQAEQLARAQAEQLARAGQASRGQTQFQQQ
jgi:hypothetical protein